MDAVVYIVGALLVAVILAFISYKFKGKASEEQPEAVARRILPAANRADLPAGARVRQRRNRLALARQQADDGSDAEEDDDDVVLDSLGIADEKMGTKKRQKLEMKAQKRIEREQMERERAEQKERDALLEEERRKDEAKQRRLEEQKAEEAQKAKEEKEKREYEEYLLMKQNFVIEEEGQDSVQQADESQLLQEFISYVKKMKVVLLEDLASHFAIKTQDAIDRIDQLMADGTLTGVLDDRGKFIYVTREELEAVAKFIKQRGRVTIQELAESSNNLIRLAPDTQEVAS